jgi:hypothetical protein
MKTTATPPRALPSKKAGWHYDTYFIEQRRRINEDQENGQGEQEKKITNEQ